MLGHSSYIPKGYIAMSPLDHQCRKPNSNRGLACPATVDRHVCTNTTTPHRPSSIGFASEAGRVCLSPGRGPSTPPPRYVGSSPVRPGHGQARPPRPAAVIRGGSRWEDQSIGPRNVPTRSDIVISSRAEKRSKAAFVYESLPT